VGWNAFATAYPWYRTLPGPDWIGEAHNEYLQVLLDGGIVGAGLLLGLLAVALRGALTRARTSPLDLGLLGALVGLALNALVDFSWQIPANAATWTALAALATRPARDPDRPTAHGLLKPDSGPHRMNEVEASTVLPPDATARV